MLMSGDVEYCFWYAVILNVDIAESLNVPV